MKIISFYNIFILFLLQLDLSPNEELFNFFIVILGITVLIIILVYILLTSKQEE